MMTEKDKLRHTVLRYHAAVQQASPRQRIQHGFQQVDGAEGHRQPSAEVTRGASTGSHSKLSHL